VKIERLLMVAGEASGDAHGAEVIHEILRRNPRAEVFGIGGDRMRDAGMEILHPVSELAFMGVVEVARHLPFIAEVRRELLRSVDARKPQAALLIDYPGFNLRFARELKRRGVPVGYYVSPQVWAWGSGRVAKMRDVIDRMFLILPFEVPIYESAGMAAEFVGHPLLEEIDHLDEPMTADGDRLFRERHGLKQVAPLVALLPGSRLQEVRRMLPLMLEALRHVRLNAEIAVAVASSPTIPASLYRDLGCGEGVRVLTGETHELLRAVAAAARTTGGCAVVKSGTGTLEAALHRTPMVIVYRTSGVTYLLGRMFVRIPYIGLANIAAGRRIVPELIQRDCTPRRIAREVESLLMDSERRSMMIDALAGLRENLGSAGASSRVADGLERLIESARALRSKQPGVGAQ